MANKTEIMLLEPLQSPLQGVPTLMGIRGTPVPEAVSYLHYLLNLEPEPMEIIYPTSTDPIYKGSRSKRIIGEL